MQQNVDRLLTPQEDIVATKAKELRQELQAKLQESGQGLTVDLGQVQMIDSTGLGVLIAAHNSLQQQGQSLRLINVSQDLLELMQTMRLDKHFQIESQ
ncbi:MAG: STAS domain-containing protein [Thermodesulfobacteriota bacterium]